MDQFATFRRGKAVVRLLRFVGTEPV